MLQFVIEAYRDTFGSEKRPSTLHQRPLLPNSRVGGLSTTPIDVYPPVPATQVTDAESALLEQIQQQRSGSRMSAVGTPKRGEDSFVQVSPMRQPQQPQPQPQQPQLSGLEQRNQQLQQQIQTLRQQLQQKDQESNQQVQSLQSRISQLEQTLQQQQRQQTQGSQLEQRYDTLRQDNEALAQRFDVIDDVLKRDLNDIGNYLFENARFTGVKGLWQEHEHVTDEIMRLLWYLVYG